MTVMSLCSKCGFELTDESITSCQNCGFNLSELGSNNYQPQFSSLSENSQNIKSENEDWIFNFTLTKSVSCNNIKSSDFIEFKTKDNYLIGFSIIVKNRAEMTAKKIAEKKSLRLARLITLHSSQYVLPKLTNYKNIRKKTFCIIKSSILRFDIGGHLEGFEIDNKIKNILNDNDKLWQRIIHAYRGISSYNNNEPVNAIKELFASIENWSVNDYEKYEILRDILSHPFPTNTIQKLNKYFTIDYFDLINNSFDYDSLKNYYNLNKEANLLLKIVRDTLISKLRS